MSGTIEPVVVERIPLAEAARAHELPQGGGFADKILLTTPPSDGGVGAA